MRPEHHEGWAAVLLTCVLERRGTDGAVVPVSHPQPMPPICLEPALHILREGKRGVAVDGDVVVVVHEGEFGKAQVTGERDRLARDALHEISITHEGPRAV